MSAGTGNEGLGFGEIYVTCRLFNGTLTLRVRATIRYNLDKRSSFLPGDITDDGFVKFAMILKLQISAEAAFIDDLMTEISFLIRIFQTYRDLRVVIFSKQQS